MEDKPRFRSNPYLKLMDQVREVLRYHHYAYRTESLYCQWILRYVRYLLGAKPIPKNPALNMLNKFLSNLATPNTYP